jgi:hypothetical protein
MSGGQMDDFLANTLTNVNELIETANNTIQNTLGGAATVGTSKNLYDEYKRKEYCITKGQPSCDKDDFDLAFSEYVQSLPVCAPPTVTTGCVASQKTKSDVDDIFRSIYTQQGANAKELTMSKINDMKTQITDLLTVSNEQMRYYNHLSDLEGKYSEAQQTVTADVDKQTALLKTSNRKQYYEQQQNSLVQQYATKIARAFYWVAVFAWVIVILLRGKTTPVNGGLTLLFVAFPFVSDILIVWAFKIGSAVYSLLPTDAYLDMS